MNYIYLLRHDHTHRSYIGYTTDPWRRLRQHNGEIKGGARCTTRASPDWVLLAYVGSSSWDKGTAMALERGVKRHRGWESRLQALRSIMGDEEWVDSVQITRIDDNKRPTRRERR